MVYLASMLTIIPYEVLIVSVVVFMAISKYLFKLSATESVRQKSLIGLKLIWIQSIRLRDWLPKEASLLYYFTYR